MLFESRVDDIFHAGNIYVICRNQAINGSRVSVDMSEARLFCSLKWYRIRGIRM